jgi:hypothetical protein
MSQYPKGRKLTLWSYEQFEETFLNFVGELDTTALVSELTGTYYGQRYSC